MSADDPTPAWVRELMAAHVKNPANQNSDALLVYADGQPERDPTLIPCVGMPNRAAVVEALVQAAVENLADRSPPARQILVTVGALWTLAIDNTRALHSGRPEDVEVIFNLEHALRCDVASPEGA